MMVPVVLLCMAMVLPLCASVAPMKPAEKVSSDSLSAEPHRRFGYFFIEAVRCQNAGDFDGAFDLYRHCLRIDPQAPEAYHALAMFYSELEQDSLALAYLEKAAELQPGNDTYQERVAQFYIGGQNYDKAIRAYEQLYAHHRDRIDVLEILAQLYRYTKDYDHVLSVYDRMEQLEGTTEGISLARMNAYEQKGEKDSALQVLQTLVESHPLEAGYKVMLGNWLMKNSREEQAFALFTEALRAEPDNEQALSSMYDYYRKQGQDSMALQLRDQLLMSRKTPTKTKVTMMQQAIKENEQEQGDSTIILNLFDKVIEAQPENADFIVMKAAYMDLKEMPKDAVDTVFRQALEVEPDNAPVRVQLIQHAWTKADWATVIAQCRLAVQYNPDEMAFYYYLGIAYVQLDEDDKALDALKRGVDEINDQSNADLVSDFYAVMGDLLHKKGKVEEAFAAYDSCLQWKEDNISCLNNYAYYLSLRGQDLQKAEQMSYKTVKAEPDNATYLDTYAWILFMQGRYADARIYIDQALSTEAYEPSPEVLEHAGDIYALNNELPRALELWQKAADVGGKSPQLVRKLKKRKYLK